MAITSFKVQTTKTNFYNWSIFGACHKKPFSPELIPLLNHYVKEFDAGTLKIVNKKEIKLNETAL